MDSLAFALRYPHLHTHTDVPSLLDLRLFSAGGGNELVEWDVNSGTILVRCYHILHTHTL